MAVYVDEMQACITNSKWRYKTVCHMMADTLDELHLMAIVIGLQYTWFQKSRFPHYDLTTSKRKLAIRKGAVFNDSYRTYKTF